MNSDVSIQSQKQEVERIKMKSGKNAKIAFVSGNFNVVHPGHLRLFKFAAEYADFLLVGVNTDETDGVFLPQKYRLEGVRAISYVDDTVALSGPPEVFVAMLKPDFVIKGKEHEKLINCEQPIIEQYGGKLIFSSGDTIFSSIELIQQEFQKANGCNLKKPVDYLERHDIKKDNLIAWVKRISSLNVIVVGDLIVDEYITCDPLGLSREDPTVVVTPIKRDKFLGGAGIVAAHAAGLQAKVRLFSVVGDDEAGSFASNIAHRYGIDYCLLTDESRPTTLKQRFRAKGKTLLRVSHLRQHDISKDLIQRIKDCLLPAIEEADLIVFSDFNYGCLPQPLVDDLIAACSKREVIMVADSQSSSQIGDISRFTGMKLITPTEHEARLAVRDSSAGLAVLADILQRKAQADTVFITLGEEGMLIYSPSNPSNGLNTDQLPAFNQNPRDVSGAGDSLLTCASMALAVGASVWESAYFGSIAAACQVARVGNSPLSANEIISELLR